MTRIPHRYLYFDMLSSNLRNYKNKDFLSLNSIGFNTMIYPMTICVAPLLWPRVGVKLNTWKSRELESSGTPECLELDSKAQNTLPWGDLGVIGKFWKCRCPKWPRIGHLDICSPSYGQKKGRESNWQFDSRALKVENRPVRNVRSKSATRR
jgi:hypothetical protein